MLENAMNSYPKIFFREKVRDQFADNAHSRQDHDVDRRMRIEPEHMLEQDRVAADRRIENSDMRDTFKRQQQDRDRDDRRAEDHHEAGRVMCPNEQAASRNQVIPGARIVWIVTIKFRPVRIDENPLIKIPSPTAIT